MLRCYKQVIHYGINSRIKSSTLRIIETLDYHQCRKNYTQIYRIIFWRKLKYKNLQACLKT